MVINGFGKTIGLVQVEELGTIETPILLTNTLSVGTAATALGGADAALEAQAAHPGPRAHRALGEVRLCGGYGLEDVLLFDVEALDIVEKTVVAFAHQRVDRACRTANVPGLARTGSYYGNGSGDIAIAFTTANRVPHDSPKALLDMKMLSDDHIDPVFHIGLLCSGNK